MLALDGRSYPRESLKLSLEKCAFSSLRNESSHDPTSWNVCYARYFSANAFPGESYLTVHSSFSSLLHRPMTLWPMTKCLTPEVNLQLTFARTATTLLDCRINEHYTYLFFEHLRLIPYPSIVYQKIWTFRVSRCRDECERIDRVYFKVF